MSTLRHALDGTTGVHAVTVAQPPSDPRFMDVLHEIARNPTIRRLIVTSSLGAAIHMRWSLEAQHSCRMILQIDDKGIVEEAFASESEILICPISAILKPWHIDYEDISVCCTFNVTEEQAMQLLYRAPSAVHRMIYVIPDEGRV